VHDQPLDTPGSTRGRLLLATPELADPNFFRAVVFMLEHSDEGALGVVLNRPSDVRVESVLPAWSALCSAPSSLYVGGPVQPESAIALGATTDDSNEGVLALFDGLATVDLEQDPGTIAPGVRELRLFLGYAGWEAGQLDAELRLGGWVVVDAEPDDVFTRDPSDLWRAALRRQPGRLSILAFAPEDPSTN
jgi:putative transcriptional regulator